MSVLLRRSIGACTICKLPRPKIPYTVVTYSITQGQVPEQCFISVTLRLLLDRRGREIFDLASHDVDAPAGRGVFASSEPVRFDREYVRPQDSL